MNDSLAEAKQIIANNRTEKAARDLLTTDQRELVTEDYLSRKEYLSASHFTPSAEKRAEFIWNGELMKLKNQLLQKKIGNG